MTQFNGRTKICYGEESLNVLETLPVKHACIVTDPFMVKIGFVDKIVTHFDRINVPHSIFEDVEPDPSLETIVKGTSKMIDHGADVIIALGGGSAIDAAKAMMYFAYKANGSKNKPMLVVIPTTSGTGSEVSSISVVTDTEKQMKIPMVDELMIPDLAILDANFTKTVPPGITADTGMDVLTHAIEAYISKGANIFADIYSEHAIKDVFKYLIRAYKNGDDMEARERLLVASCMAGTAFNNCGLGINHSMAHILGGIFHIPHGKANAVILPHILEYNGKACGARFQALAKLLKLPASSGEEAVISIIEAVKWLNLQLGIPSKIRDLGIDSGEYHNSLDKMAKTAMDDPCTKTNPVTPTIAELKGLFLKAW